MAFKRPSAAKQTTATQGLGALTLIPNTGDTRSFEDALGVGPVKGRFMLRGNGYYQMFRGTFTAPDQLTRDETLKSSNTDGNVSLPPGTCDVYLLDYWQFLSDRFTGDKVLANADASNTWIFNGTSAAALTFPAISAAMPDFWGFVKNVSSLSLLTLTANGADTFDEAGATTLILYPGQGAHIFLDADVWRVVRSQAPTLPGRNKILNGNMRIDQRNAGVSRTVVGTEYTLDRWAMYSSVASKYSVIQSSDAPPGFATSMLITSLSAYTPGTSELFAFAQHIEGINISDMNWGSANAAPVAFSFWVKSSLTGTFSACLINSGFNRAYPFNYAVNAANTWEKKTIPISGDQSGTWLTTAGVGVRCYFDLGSNNSYNQTQNAWGANGYSTASGSVKLVSNNAATLRTTGLQFEVGSIATPFENVDYATMLQRCQRHYCKTFTYSVVPANNTGSGAGLLTAAYCNGTDGANLFAWAVQWQFPVPMRTIPTVTRYGYVTANTNWWNATINDGSTTSGVDGTLSEERATFYNTNAVNLASGGRGYLHATADAELL